MCTDVTVADIVMVIDDSWRIGRLNFKAICKFLEKVVNAFDVGIDKVRIGLVKYSGDPKIEWHLNSYTTKDEVITSLRNLPFKGGATMTGRALTFFRENSFRLQSGSRGNVSKIAILVTKGKSQDEMAVPAQSLRDAGVELFVIGVAYINETELKLIASKPDETHVYNVPDISFLNDILDGLTSNVCDAIKRQEEEIRRVKNADEELKVITSKPDETHVYNITDFSTINTVTEGQTCNVIDTVKQQEEKIRPLEQMRIFCLKNADAEEP
ncbi:collagen alpha-1(XIV) chain-like [Astyanax mexicanus]|uniref:collagen alpha-1(XIV) chain-like n=1 Tax=Astyanax mexicanus TaxID=7994 RepID=UPI0020CAE390|nr:collagen alpha-1(XIV) chain-like [Astyanax mexicanus]